MAILEAFHRDGRAIEEIQELLDISAAVGSLPADLTKRFLEDTTLATEDVKEEAMSNEGPQGVPYFIFGRKGQQRRKIVLSGPQTTQVFEEAMKNLSL